jgi:hypothetical protein
MTVNAVQRQRILTLMTKDIDTNGVLDKAERAELVALQQLAGVAPDSPLALVREWASGRLSASFPNSVQRSMTPSQRLVELARLRWPTTLMTPKQRIVELFRQRGLWDMNPAQRVMDRLRA